MKEEEAENYTADTVFLTVVTAVPSICSELSVMFSLSTVVSHPGHRMFVKKQ